MVRDQRAQLHALVGLAVRGEMEQAVIQVDQTGGSRSVVHISESTISLDCTTLSCEPSTNYTWIAQFPHPGPPQGWGRGNGI